MFRAIFIKEGSSRFLQGASAAAVLITSVRQRIRISFPNSECYFFKGSRNDVVRIVTRIQVGQFGVRIQADARDFSLQNVQTGSEPSQPPIQ
jgi:hypothetical protein